MTTKEEEKKKETDADKLLKKATGKIGSSYKYGGTGPNEFDCSGFVYWCHAQIGITVPRTSSDQYDQDSDASGEKGSLVFLRKMEKLIMLEFVMEMGIWLMLKVQELKKSALVVLNPVGVWEKNVDIKNLLIDS